jgi:hypothetical protein
LLKQETFTISGDLPPSKRRSVLELQIRRWSPFRASQWAVVWSGNRASVFAWDRDRVNAAIAAESFDPAGCKIVPEPFVRAPSENGIRLVAASDGYEAQVWEAGFLSASRWWSTPPAASDWAVMMRLARISGQSQTIVMPTAVDVPLSPESWAIRRDALEDALGLLDVPKYRVAAAVAVGALPLFLIAQWLTTVTANAALDRDRAHLMQASESVRRDRQAALTNLDAVEDLLALEPFPAQYELLSRAVKLLTPQQLKIAEWNFDNGTLDFSVQGGNGDIDATHLIEVFEKDDLFEGVSTKTLPQEHMLRVHMNVTPIAGRT